MPKRIVVPDGAAELPRISASMRAAFKRCRFQWHFRYQRKIETRIKATPLRFGTLLHTALEQYYIKGVKRGVHPAVTFSKVYGAELKEAAAMGFKDEDGVWYDAHRLGTEMLEHYVDHYGTDRDWKVLATEASFEQPVVEPGTHQVIGQYIGVIDVVMLHVPSDQVWFWDHKGVKTIDTSYLTMDDQSSGYWTFGEEWLRQRGVLKPEQKLMGIKFNFLRKAVRDERPRNAQGQYCNKPQKAHYVTALSRFGAHEKLTLAELEAIATQHNTVVLGDVSEKQPGEYFERFTSHRGQAEKDFTRLRCAAELREIAMVKAGTLELLKTPDKMNCKFCDVRDICELHETGNDWEEMMRLIMMPRRPFERIAVEFEHEH